MKNNKYNDYGLGNMIKQNREELKLSQGELGQLVGLTYGAISQFERCIRPDININRLMELCSVLKMDPTIAIHHSIHNPELRSMYDRSVDYVNLLDFKRKNLHLAAEIFDQEILSDNFEKDIQISLLILKFYLISRTNID